MIDKDVQVDIRAMTLTLMWWLQPGKMPREPEWST